VVIGIIGTGKMGSTLVEGLYSTNQKDQIFVYNRTYEKALCLKNRFNQLEIVNTPEAVVENSGVVVLAVPFSFIKNMSMAVFNTLKSVNPFVIVLCGYVPLKILEKHCPGKVAKAFPNINWACGSGVTIVSFGDQIKASERPMVLEFLSSLGDVYEVEEAEFRAFSNLMSCGPALWLKIIDLFIKANVMKYGINRALAFEVSEKTILGTFKLMHKNGFKFDEIINLVSTPGGVTEVGLSIFEKYLPAVFSKTIEMISKRDVARMKALQH